MTAAGATVVMCTHLLLEAEGLADQVVVLEDGHALISGTPDELTARFWPGAVVGVRSRSGSGRGGWCGSTPRMRRYSISWRTPKASSPTSASMEALPPCSSMTWR